MSGPYWKDFYCWDVLNCEPEDARKVKETSAAEAAQKYAEDRWNDSDHTIEMDVAVRDAEEPRTARVFRVEARQEWNFYASELPTVIKLKAAK